jgi:hypothetical protein
MSPTKPHTPHLARGLHITVRCAARVITRLLSACMDRVRAVLAALGGRDDVDPDRRVRPHVATLAALGALGWHVTEIRPDRDASALWRVAIKRYDGAVSIIVIDAIDPDAALEELARYAVADAEDDVP